MTSQEQGQGQDQEAEEWSEDYRFWGFKPDTHLPPKRPVDENGEIWPQFIKGIRCNNQAERDHRERINRDTEMMSETTDYQEDPRKRLLMSPPTTPPHIRQQAAVMNPSRHCLLDASWEGNEKSRTKIRKTKTKNRYVPRRPATRSTGIARLALHDRKGHVIVQKLFASEIMSFTAFVQEYVSAEIRSIVRPPTD